jgi:SAM-dependent methyltransferase
MAEFERIEPGTIPWDTYYGNHIARYRFASRLLSAWGGAGPVLDAACGVGYGTHHLASSLDCHVTGVDRDAHALRMAAKYFAHPRVAFRADDCATLDSAALDAPFGAIISFETLEHLPVPDTFLAACRRLLAPGGLLVCSTPNAGVSSPGGQATWEFHEREFTAGEFATLLSTVGFGRIDLYGQQLTAMGRLREDLRRELHTVRSNPFFRLGSWVQRRVRGRHISVPLPEHADDFDFVRFESPESIDAQGVDGPFVVIAVASA